MHVYCKKFKSPPPPHTHTRTHTRTNHNRSNKWCDSPSPGESLNIYKCYDLLLEGWGGWIQSKFLDHQVHLDPYMRSQPALSLLMCGPGRHRPRGLPQPEETPLQEVNGSLRAVTTSRQNDQPNGTAARDHRDDQTSARHASPSNGQSSLPSPTNTHNGGGTAADDRSQPPGPSASASSGRLDTPKPATLSHTGLQSIARSLNFPDPSESLTASRSPDINNEETARKAVAGAETAPDSIETTVTAMQDSSDHDTWPTHLYS